jgi:hypothetical protein
LAKIAYRNNTYGRDLFDTMPAGQFKNVSAKKHYAFIIDHDVKTIGLVSDQYYFLKNIKSGKQEFVSVTGNEITGTGPREDSIKNQMNGITDAWYETAKYLLLNNKKKN